jgi:hypothetical protein
MTRRALDKEMDLKVSPWRPPARGARAEMNPHLRKALLYDLKHVTPPGREEGGINPRTVKFISFLSLWAACLLLCFVYFQIRCYNLNYRARGLSQELVTLQEENEELLADMATLQSPDELEPRALDVGLVWIETVDVCRVPMAPAQKLSDAESPGDVKDDIFKRVAKRLKDRPLDQEGAG